MARPTLTRLIQRVRGLAGDAGPDAILTDDEIAEAVDVWLTPHRGLLLVPLPTFRAGHVTYAEFAAPRGWDDWEDGVRLYGADGVDVVPVEADLQRGVWTFLDPPPPPPLFADGNTCDVYGAAADVLELIAAKLKTQFDFSDAAGQRFARSQKAAAALALAERYRKRQRPMVVPSSRPDAAGGVPC